MVKANLVNSLGDKITIQKNMLCKSVMLLNVEFPQLLFLHLSKVDELFHDIGFIFDELSNTGGESGVQMSESLRQKGAKDRSGIWKHLATPRDLMTEGMQKSESQKVTAVWLLHT